MLLRSDRPQPEIPHPVSTSRRRFLQLGVVSATALFLPRAFADSPAGPERRLSLLNLHTGESLNATYWAEGRYQADELKAINHILRDHRTDDIHCIDKGLLDLLNCVHHGVNAKVPFQVISGYRSPATNSVLSQRSSGVARKSLHMQGKAIDLRLPGCPLSELRQAALDSRSGGVGYYPKSDFIHIDTGPVRHWG